MALPATTVWEVRTDGNDANGGGVVAGGGGGFLTIAQGITLSTVAGMMVYVRGGTYNITRAFSPASLSGAYRTRLVGYATTRGDLGQPVISVTAAIDGLTPGLGGTFENLELDGTSGGLEGGNPTTV